MTRAIRPFRALQQQINRDFDEMFKSPFGSGGWLDWAKWPSMEWPKWEEIAPRVNVSEKDGVILIEAAIPGMDSKNLEVSLQDDVLTLKGEYKEEKEEKGNTIHRKEFSSGSFERAITLPARVQADKAEAKFEKGMLKLTLPVVAEDRERVKKIPIKAV
ncbi:MAG: Hsp20/alpha crystallin family protein [SAR324 cluster bacterium]